MDEHTKDRIKFIRKSKKITQENFAKPLNLSGNFIHLIEKGDRQPSERTLSDIARIYRVNENWLKTGDGDPWDVVTPDIEIASTLGDVLRDDESFRTRLFLALSKMSDSEMAAIEKLIENLSGDKE